MGLGKYRVVYNIWYNRRAEHCTKYYADNWTVEELTQFTFFRLFPIYTYWSEHKESDGYDSTTAIKYHSPEEAFAHIERVLNGNPRNKKISRVITEVDHERTN